MNNSITVKIPLFLHEREKQTTKNSCLVGGFNPFEKYARQNGFIFPKFRGENKKYLSCHHPENNQPKTHFFLAKTQDWQHPRPRFTESLEKSVDGKVGASCLTPRFNRPLKGDISDKYPLY